MLAIYIVAVSQWSHTRFLSIYFISFRIWFVWRFYFRKRAHDLCERSQQTRWTNTRLATKEYLWSSIRSLLSIEALTPRRMCRWYVRRKRAKILRRKKSRVERKKIELKLRFGDLQHLIFVTRSLPTRQKFAFAIQMEIMMFCKMRPAYVKSKINCLRCVSLTPTQCLTNGDAISIWIDDLIAKFEIKENSFVCRKRCGDFLIYARE